MNIPRVVPDTNLWVAARFNPRSYSARILQMAGEGKVVLLWSDDTRRELERILKNVKAPAQYISKVKALLAGGANVGETERISVIKDDPDDDTFLACAAAGRADYIVTNDEHLLALEVYRGTRIVVPKAFVREAAGEVDDGL